VHRIERGPSPDLVREVNASVKLIPRLACSYEVENLLVQIDQVYPFGGDVGFRGWRIVADVDDVYILLQYPIECLNPPVVIEVEEVVIRSRPKHDDGYVTTRIQVTVALVSNRNPGLK
jgi:hypothetical protein